MINGVKMWNMGLYVVIYDMVFVWMSGEDGDVCGIICLFILMDVEGFKIEEYLWIFNMFMDYFWILLNDVWVFEFVVFGFKDGGLVLV